MAGPLRPENTAFATATLRICPSWDSGVLFEESEGTLFCSDLFHQAGDVAALSFADVVGRSPQALKEYQAGILAEYVPYTPLTARNLKKLSDL